MNIRLKRIYEPKAPGDGLWPRGIAREAGLFDARHKAIAPSRELRRGYGPLTFVFAPRDAEHNNAVALRDYLEGRRET